MAASVSTAMIVAVIATTLPAFAQAVPSVVDDLCVELKNSDYQRRMAAARRIASLK